MHIYNKFTNEHLHCKKMNPDKYFVVSDLHLGNHYFNHRAFIAWLDQLPLNATLVLNGDIIDDPAKPLNGCHDAVLKRIIVESSRRSVVWIHGNHDADFQMKDIGKIRFLREWKIVDRLLIVHGHKLDNVMPSHPLFKWVFRRFHDLCVMAGLRDMHVAQYAKRWPRLYKVLNNRVAQNGMKLAKVNGCRAIACGHTHFAMDDNSSDIRYLNTGSWTEIPLHYLSIDSDSILLREWIYE